MNSLSKIILCKEKGTELKGCWLSLQINHLCLDLISLWISQVIFTTHLCSFLLIVRDRNQQNMHVEPKDLKNEQK